MFDIACPKFVPIVVTNRITKEAEEVVRTLRLEGTEVDTVILGCTRIHWSDDSKVVGDGVTLIDSRRRNSFQRECVIGYCKLSRNA